MLVLNHNTFIAVHELSYIFKFTHSKSFKSKVILSSVKYSSAGVYCVVNEDIET